MNITAFINAVFRESGMLRKFMMVMKITSFILLVALMQVSAAGLAQKISLNEKNMSLKYVIEKVRQQSGYNFLYIKDVLDDAKPVHINVKNADFKQTLNKIFANQPFDYVIQGKDIIIKKKAPSFLDRVIDAIVSKDIRGKVLDENGKPLPGAVVKVKGTTISLTTNNDGEFIVKDIKSKTVLQISYIGYRLKEYTVLETESFISINMELSDNKLKEVNIVSTGYQKLPKERVTGSFELIDKELLNRSPGTDVISRLKGITTSTLFGNPNGVPTLPQPQASTIPGIRKTSPLASLTIRGISTLGISGGMLPLVVVDNFPYEGDINNLNPNDVESITILKDAAAASIWGIRASNGVIVITTKKASYEQPVRVNVNSNVTIGEKPDLYYNKVMSTSDYINIERFLFDQGVYNRSLTDKVRRPVSPVIELLGKQRDLPITDVIGRNNIDKQIDQLRQYDRREDILKYLYRESLNQQYSINLTGGSKQFTYLLSGGFDKNRDSEVEFHNQRSNLRSLVSFIPIKNLEISSEIYYTNNQYHSPSYKDVNGRILNHLPSYPYLRLADDQENPLEIINPRGFLLPLKYTYRRTAGNGRLLDWSYVPLNDIGTNYSNSISQNFLTNFGINYKINTYLSASVNYQYNKNVEEAVSHSNVNSFMMRDAINSYATYNTTDLSVPATFVYPLGGRYDKRDVFQVNNKLRGQLNFGYTWNQLHELNGLIGAEKSESVQTATPGITLFGYTPDPLSFQSFPYNIPLRLLNANQATEIFRPQTEVENLVNRTTSIFFNAAYTYNNRYSLSVSARKDAANIFGVDANRRGKPNWSMGTSWNLTNEEFFRPGLLKTLKLRATYGYLGNINNTISAYPTISYAGFPDFTTNFNYASVINPPNPGLGPERSGIFNLGVDFSLRNSRISGTLEYYDKRSKNLIAPTPLDLTTGFTSLNVNSANLKTTGFDFNINSINLQLNKFQWLSNFQFSYTHNVVTKYLLPKSDLATDYITLGDGGTPQNIYITGNDPFSLYTYRWAGLDPSNGDPMGYDKDGKPSKDYLALTGIKVNELENQGSVIPLYYGAFRNTFNWKAFSLSANIIYKFGYKMSPRALSSTGIYSANSIDTYGDYARRWQKPGDEKITNVPSVIYPADPYRDLFYLGSSARIISGNHIRLQDIRVSYSINKNLSYFKNLQLYSNVSNIGILWRANKIGIDPDTFMNVPTPRTYTIGLTAGL